MPKLRERLHLIRDARLRNLAVLKANAADGAKDFDGRCTVSLASSLQFIAVADFVLDKAVGRFRSQLADAGKLRLSVFERFDRGEKISASFVTMLSYQWLFADLAAGNYQGAQLLANKMDGREEISKQLDHPFDQTFGQALQAVVLERPAANDAIVRLAEISASPQRNDFQGYPPALAAIMSRNDAELDLALVEILTDHKRLATTGIFANTEDELVAIWPLGLVNLARHRGMKPKVATLLVPQELLV